MSELPCCTAREWDRFINRLIELELEAHQLGLVETAQKLNRAKQKAGWERADQIHRAAALCRKMAATLDKRWQERKAAPCLKVQRRMCATCIYRPDSSLDIAKLEADVADPRMEGYFKGHRVCHHSKDTCCRGFWEAHKDHFTAGQLAQRLNLVEFVDVDVLA